MLFGDTAEVLACNVRFPFCFVDFVVVNSKWVFRSDKFY